MSGRRLVVRLAVLAIAGTAAAVAAAATPDAARMALQSADVPGAKISGHATKPGKGYVASYARTFSLKTPFGRSALVFIESDVNLASATATATKDFAGIRTYLRSPKGREELATAFVKGAGKNVKRKDLTLGALRTPAIGDGAVELAATLKLNGGRVYAAFTFFRLDRVVETLITLGVRPVVQADVLKLGSLIVAHAGSQFIPASTAPPTIAGTPQQGQTLTASPGTWDNGPTPAYQWQRCDAAGAACADVAGATAQTYVVPSTDVGATLRVNVTATNRFGTATAQSAQTAVVT
jgi:hypothetical protein